MTDTNTYIIPLDQDAFYEFINDAQKDSDTPEIYMGSTKERNKMPELYKAAKSFYPAAGFVIAERIKVRK
ncbi:MAG: hypothetical protein LBL75_03685 [Rickettsiales bacterium]|jgi:hypothetical protein|nr:hypothetical protein [Rickettsiales bacterium]